MANIKVNTATIRKSPSGRINFTLRSANGKVIAFSTQGYEKKSEALRIVRTYFPAFVIVDEAR
jgi:uncharacterized protein YegP (UPF0339 family)